MNRIYFPYPIEVLLKVISWITVIAIDLVEFILAPFMHIGFKCFTVLSFAAAIFTGYAHFAYDLVFNHTLILFGVIIAGLLAFLVLIRVLKLILTKVVRPPFADIVFG